MHACNAGDISLSADGVPFSTEAYSSAVPPLDPEVREGLARILKLKRKKIITQYAHYVSSICDFVVEKGVAVQPLCTFLLQMPAFSPDIKVNSCLKGRLNWKKQTIFTGFLTCLVRNVLLS